MNAHDALYGAKAVCGIAGERKITHAEWLELSQCLAVLTALVERAGEPVAWMPIETAPKDGTYILVTNEEAGGSWVAKWEPVYVSGFAPENPWMSMMLNTWHLPSRYPSLKPTLWQPLPAAPGASHER